MNLRSNKWVQDWNFTVGQSQSSTNLTKETTEKLVSLEWWLLAARMQVKIPKIFNSSSRFETKPKLGLTSSANWDHFLPGLLFITDGLLVVVEDLVVLLTLFTRGGSDFTSCKALKNMKRNL